MNQRNDRSSLLSFRLSGVFLLLLLAVAFFVCVYAVLRGGVYREALQTRGKWLCGGSVGFALVFFLIWRLRRDAIDKHLLETYGEECCKPIRVPTLAADGAEEDAKDAPTKP